MSESTVEVAGEELIRIKLEVYSVWLEFQTFSVDIGGSFIIKYEDREEPFSGSDKVGDLHSLWRLIGRRLTSKSSTQALPAHREITLAFSSGEQIIIAESLRPRGTVISHNYVGFDDF